MATSLSELREALAALGVSTATDGLRGEQRRVELLRRLQEATGGSSSTASSSDKNAGDHQAQQVELWSLSELRQALEARGLPTLTPGLKGDARRHALVQRVINAQNASPGGAYSVNDNNGRDQASTSRSDEDAGTAADNDDALSITSGRSYETSSTEYSTAREFLFFDLPTPTAASTTRHRQQHATVSKPTVPALNLPAQKDHHQLRHAKAFHPTRSISAIKSEDDELEAQQDALFECRLQLHAIRRQRQQQVEASLERVGITQRLEKLSARLEALSREKKRLESSHFGHEIVSSLVLGALSTARSAEDVKTQPRPLELVQNDALELIRRHEHATQLLIERTKQAVAIVKTSRRDDPAEVMSARNEHQLENEIQQLEAQIHMKSSLSARSCMSNPEEASFSKDQKAVDPVLTRCRSVPHNMFLQEWKQLTMEQRQQLHTEMRRIASIRHQQGRVCVENPFQALHSGDNIRSKPVVPSRADRLGVKARFLEMSRRNVLDINRAYQAALAEDANHVQNLVNYANFLSIGLANRAYTDQAEQYLQRAIAIDPKNAYALSSYAVFLNSVRKDTNNASVYFEKVRKHCGANGKSRIMPKPTSVCTAINKM